MTRISRTAALSAAAVLALGIAACSPPNQKNSDAPQVTTVSPESGYEGSIAGATSATAPTGATEATDTLGVTDLSTGADTEASTGSADGVVSTTQEPSAY